MLSHYTGDADKQRHDTCRTHREWERIILSPFTGDADKQRMTYVARLWDGRE